MNIVKLGTSAPATAGESEYAFVFVCGAYEEGNTYRPGAMVTYADGSGGVSIYVATTSTTESPPHADWFCMTSAAAGTPGDNAPLVTFQYSLDGSTGWVDTWVPGYKYQRCSNDDGATWTAGMKFIGDDGDGAGDVRGPSEVVNERIVLFDGASGKVIKDGGVALSDLATASHTHSGVYAVVDHNHDGIYSPVSHDHDSDYAALSHTHSDYASLDGWASYGSITTASTSTFTVTNNTDNEAIFTPGRPLKLEASGTVHYCIVKTWSSGTVTIMGSALISSTAYNCSYGAFDKLIQADLFLSGSFADAWSASAYRDKSNDFFFWGLPPARMVGILQRITAADSAATTAQPKVNVFMGTPSSSTTITGSGTSYAISANALTNSLSISVGGSVVDNYEVNFQTGSVVFDEAPGSAPTASYKCWTTNDKVLSSNLVTNTAETDSGITVQRNNARILRGDRVEVLVEKASGGTPGNDAENLSLSLFFVME